MCGEGIAHNVAESVVKSVRRLSFAAFWLPLPYNHCLAIPIYFPTDFGVEYPGWQGPNGMPRTTTMGRVPILDSRRNCGQPPMPCGTTWTRPSTSTSY